KLRLMMDAELFGAVGRAQLEDPWVAIGEKPLHEELGRSHEKLRSMRQGDRRQGVHVRIETGTGAEARCGDLQEPPRREVGPAATHALTSTEQRRRARRSARASRGCDGMQASTGEVR